MSLAGKNTILLTGAAGFIGSRTAELLLKEGTSVAGVDNLNDYYDPRLKKNRLNLLKKYPGFKFYQSDIEDFESLKKIMKTSRPSAVINLAARAGVRYSMENPFVYMSTNATGMLNILEACKELDIKKVIIASTSSLYAGQKMPFKETLPVNTPISPYAASKKAAEAMCFTYHHLYHFDVTILRYFTVYGPAGRPDMSPFRFIQWIDSGKPVQIFGDGKQSRDFTYVDDIAQGTVSSLGLKGFQTINLGSHHPYKLIEFIRLIEKFLGKKANLVYLPKNVTDMDATWADIGQAKKLLKWTPKTSLEKGLRLTIDWYLQNKDWASKISV